MKEDVGMSKPKKDANKVRWNPKLNKPLPHNHTEVQFFIFCFISTYVGLYGSGLFNFGFHPNLVRILFGF